MVDVTATSDSLFCSICWHKPHIQITLFVFVGNMDNQVGFDGFQVPLFFRSFITSLSVSLLICIPFNVHLRYQTSVWLCYAMTAWCLQWMSQA